MTPWSRGDAVRLTVGVVAGAFVVGLAWNGAATRSELDDQTGFVLLGVAGFLVAVVAQSLWLERGRRAVGAYASTVETSLAVLVDQPPAAALGAAGGLVATGDMRHFHRPNCPIAAGRRWSAQPQPVHEAAGRTPCDICKP